MTIGADAAVAVTETITFGFKSMFTAAFRTIPLRTPDGRLVRVRDVSAHDADGTLVNLRVTEHEHVLALHTRVPLAMGNDGDSPLRLSYRIYRALRHTTDGDVLEWTVLPNEWNAFVRRLRVYVHFPSSLPPRADVRMTLTTPTGDPLSATMHYGDRMVWADATEPAGPGDSVRLSLGWPSGHVNFAAPAPLAPFPFVVSQAWAVPAAIVLLTALASLRGRYAGGRAVVAAYAPPAGLRPGEAGVVIDGRVDPADIVAAVVDLAVRGYVSLERAPHAADVTVSIGRPWIADREVKPWEAVLLANVFTSPGFPSTTLSVLRAPRDTASIREALSDDLGERGFFSSSPIAFRRAGRWLAVIAAAVWMQLAWNAGAGVSTFLAIVTSGGALWLLAGVLAARGLTPDGRRARHALRGYREFLARVEKDRLEQLPRGALEEPLAWAIALGVTEGWLAPTPVR